MGENKSKKVISENMLIEVTGGAQARDADVCRPTPVDEGNLATSVPICPFCNNIILGADRQCVTCMTGTAFSK